MPNRRALVEVNGFIREIADADPLIAGAASFLTLVMTGQASFVAGSAGAPGVRVGTDQSGLAQSAAGLLDIVVAGATLITCTTVGASGNKLRAEANNTPGWRPEGPGANINIQLVSKGTSSVDLFTGSGASRFSVIDAAASVNYLGTQGGATGAAAVLRAMGTDADVPIVLGTRGAAGFFFTTSYNGGQAIQVRINHLASAVNSLVLSGGASGAGVSISTTGSDTNRPIFLTPGGSALVELVSNGLRITYSKTPASATDTGTQGHLCWDASYVYVCTAANTWKRAALATW